MKTMRNRKLEIIYEDEHLIVCVKPHGLATQSRQLGSPDLESMLKNHLLSQTPTKGKPYLAIIHRLDQPVTGILVFAKTPWAAKELNKQLQNNGFGKYYYALVTGSLPAVSGTLENYLVKDARTNTSRVCNKDVPGAKLAQLHYKIIEKGQGYFSRDKSDFINTPSPTAVEIQLETGRHHQIRVQLAHIGCPIIGDTKYNEDASCEGWQTLMLCAYKLRLRHPKTNTEMTFTMPPEEKGD